MTPLGIHHVNITVTDMVAARRFYLDELGMTERTDRPTFAFDGAWIDVGGQQVHLVVGEMGPRTSDHFAILVGDLDAVINELRSYGHQVSNPMSSNANRQAFLRDPFGNFLELHQVGASPTTC